jgi:hypothetical protein
VRAGEERASSSLLPPALNACYAGYETIYSYVAALRKLAKTCNFGLLENSLIIRDRVVIGIKDNQVRKRTTVTSI